MMFKLSYIFDMWDVSSIQAFFISAHFIKYKELLPESHLNTCSPTNFFFKLTEEIYHK